MDFRSLVVALVASSVVVACTKPSQPDAKPAAPPASASVSAAPSVTAAVNAARVTGAQARKLVEGGALLVDVRTPGEFAADAVPGAINVPHDQVAGRAAEFGPKSRPVVVYCHSGRRSALAAQVLAGQGYTVYDLGPRAAW